MIISAKIVYYPYQMAGSVSSSTLVIILVVGIFLIIDIVLIVLIVVESDKVAKCTGSQSTFCPLLICDSLLTDEGTGSKPGADLNLAYPLCSSYMYRTKDGTSDTESDNIECNFPSSSDATKSFKGPTSK